MAKSGSSGVTSTSAGSPDRRLLATRISTTSSEVLNTSKIEGIVVRSSTLDFFSTHPGRSRASHPGTSRGATGAILTVKALYELERIGKRYALVTMCIGGGQGIAAIFERA